MYSTKPVETLEFHHSLLVDTIRADSFLSALLQTVKPDDVVLDIGSGTGILACFACQAGARHVYAVERGPIIGLAREICARNNLQERITFINEWSMNTALPEPVDVLVTETMGNTGLEEGILQWVLDAKKRFLKADARIIPRSVEMFAVPTESAEAYEWVGRWAHSYYNLDFSPLHTLAANNLLWMELQPEMYLSEPASMLQVDLSQVNESDFSTQASFVVKRRGILHGFSGWFTAELAEGIHLSNESPSKTPSWSQTLLPLEEPLLVESGDRVELRMRTSRQGSRWQWQVSHKGPAADKPAKFLPQQSTQAGELSTFVATADLQHKPVRNSSGDIDRFILDQLNGVQTVAEIAQQTAMQFPAWFGSQEKLLERIYQLINRYAP